jgi:hypothetical protein
MDQLCFPLRVFAFLRLASASFKSENLDKSLDEVETCIAELEVFARELREFKRTSARADPVSR